MTWLATLTHMPMQNKESLLLFIEVLVPAIFESWLEQMSTASWIQNSCLMFRHCDQNVVRYPWIKKCFGYKEKPLPFVDDVNILPNLHKTPLYKVGFKNTSKSYLYIYSFFLRTNLT